MMEAVALVDDNRNNEQPTNGSTNTSSWDLQKRRTWPAQLASSCVWLFVTVSVLVYCFLEHTATEYEVDNDIRKVLMKNNITVICYKQVKTPYSFRLLYNVSLGLMGVIISIVVDRLCLVAEEFRHISTRYDGSKWKMFKACFSGIEWPAVIALLFTYVIGNVIYPLLTRIKFDWKYVVYAFSGMGVGPLVMQILNHNTHSEVHISTIIEEKKNYHAYALAWSYYANHLNDMLPKFNTKVTALVVAKKLSSKKLVLLVSDDACKLDLSIFDSNIKDLRALEIDEKYQVKIYSFKIDGKEYRYGVKYVEEPLAALSMGMNEGDSVPNESVKYHVKLLYKELKEILKRRENGPLLEDMCVVIPIDTKRGGELGRAIHDIVKGDPVENVVEGDSSENMTHQSTPGENHGKPRKLATYTNSDI